ncbi:MAG TPA: histidine kinase dimerization/phospho-acceptor domain-containing protein [Candidatus Dormibacteraeota bacterium]|nr:histidine kinase dimerization/phospho-acceptor domain-containing protein [Candidatus Dormibacteraeota bacterium]
MNLAVEPATIVDHGALLGVPDPALAERIARETERLANTRCAASASSLLQLRMLASRNVPEAVLIDGGLVEGQPLVDVLQPFIAIAPVILLAPLQRQAEAARLVASGDVEYVARTGDFVPLAAALLARRMRWARLSESLLGPPWAAVNGDLGTIFRHEINNPLTGILGNAELVLGHSERLTAIDSQRVQTVVDLAVRLRETIRRLSNAWERRPGPLTPA